MRGGHKWKTRGRTNNGGGTEGGGKEVAHGSEEGVHRKEGAHTGKTRRAHSTWGACTAEGRACMGEKRAHTEGQERALVRKGGVHG
jgi:hypothetical protein